MLSALNHPILTAIDDANDGDSLTLVSADVYDSENTIYEYIVEVSDKSMFMLNMSKDYADALGLGESKKLGNILRFGDFIKENDEKKPVSKVKSVKEYVKIREDYIHSFIDEHERGVEPEEEE